MSSTVFSEDYSSSLCCCFSRRNRIPSRKKRSGVNLNSRSVKDYKSYRSHLVKWLTLKNEKKTAVLLDWRHKKEKPSYQSFSSMVSY